MTLKGSKKNEDSEERNRRAIEHSMLSMLMIILAILFALLVFNKMVPPDPETFNAHTEP